MAMTEQHRETGVSDGTSPNSASTMQEREAMLAQNVQAAILRIAAESKAMAGKRGEGYNTVAARIDGFSLVVAGADLIAHVTTAETGEMLSGVRYLEPEEEGNGFLRRATRFVLGNEVAPIPEPRELGPFQGTSVKGKLGSTIYSGSDLGRNANESFIQITVEPGRDLGVTHEIFVSLAQMTGLEVTAKSIPQAPAVAA